MLKKLKFTFKLSLPFFILFLFVEYGFAWEANLWPDDENSPKYSQPCLADDLIYDRLNPGSDFCSQYTDLDVYCPSTGIYPAPKCCVISYTAKLSWGEIIYETITDARCSSGERTAFSRYINPDELHTYGYQVSDNGGSDDRGFAPVCSDGMLMGFDWEELQDDQLDAFTKSACPPGQRVIFNTQSTTSTNFYCAADPGCCVLDAGACNTTMNQCCSELWERSDVMCVIGEGGTGLCSLCAGTTTGDPPVTYPELPPPPCDTDGSIYCCNGDRTGVSVLTCADVYETENSAGTTYGCLSLDQIMYNTSTCNVSDFAESGNPCIESNQCISKKCSWTTEDYLTCEYVQVGQECHFNEETRDPDIYHSCECTDGYWCLIDAESSTGLSCQRSSCAGEDESCSPGGGECCPNTEDGRVLECLEYQYGDYTCQATGELCGEGGDQCTDALDCCQDYDSAVYQRCIDDGDLGPVCTSCTWFAPLSTNPCTTATAAIDCCLADNHDWECLNGVCTPPEPPDGLCLGTECGGDCQIGYRCVNSLCEPDATCAPEVIPFFEYSGPIVDLGELIARVYSFLYPAALLLGLFYIAKSGYTLMTSEGDPNKVKNGQEDLTAAVLGILFILLSLVIVRVIINSLLGATII